MAVSKNLSNIREHVSISVCYFYVMSSLQQGEGDIVHASQHGKM
jgi:hypothetical protein